MKNLGSGNGWHRDSFSRQFKAMIYLSDVSLDNGPFQYVEGTNNYANMSELTSYTKMPRLSKRHTAEEVDSYLQKSKKTDQLQTFDAKAGSLILFDSSGLHRGHPILEGTRYALTIYAMRSRSIDQRKFEKFGLT